jgi:hypothetical protein
MQRSENERAEQDGQDMIDDIRKRQYEATHRQEFNDIRGRVQENMDNPRGSHVSIEIPELWWRIEQTEDDRAWLMTDVVRLNDTVAIHEETIKTLTVQNAVQAQRMQQQIDITCELMTKKAEVDKLALDPLILHDMELMSETIEELEIDVQRQYDQIIVEQAYSEDIGDALSTERLQHENTKKQLIVMTSTRDRLHEQKELIQSIRTNLLNSNNEQFDILQKIQDAIRPHMSIHGFHGGPSDLASHIQEILDDQQGLS